MMPRVCLPNERPCTLIPHLSQRCRSLLRHLCMSLKGVDRVGGASGTSVWSVISGFKNKKKELVRKRWACELRMYQQ